MTKLTDSVVKNAKPSSKPVRLYDGGGLYLQVNPTGARYWRLKYRFGGKEKVLALGVYPAVSLKQARERRDEARRKLSEGIDPGEQRKAVKQAAILEARNAFGAVAREWIATYGGKWSEKHRNDSLRRLENNIFPTFEARQIGDITTSELLQCLREIEGRGAYHMAARCLAMCSQIFRYGVVNGYCGRDPAADLRGALTTRKVQHMPAVRPRDVPELLAKIGSYDGDRVTRLGLRLLAATFTRTVELPERRRMKQWWADHLDGLQAEWDTNNGRE